MSLDSSISSLEQVGPADMELQQPLAVNVFDQFGDAVSAGIKVVFELESAFGQGVLRTDAGSNAYRVEALTDANGVARAYWRLPKNAGTFNATASIVDLTPVTFTATATNWVKSIVTSTLPTTAVISTELPAFTVQLYDQAGNIWSKENQISVSTGSGSGKVRNVLLAPDTAVSSLNTTTDGNGNIALVWTLGTTVGNQQLTVAVPGSAVFKVFSVAATGAVTPGQ
jgi:hypothetical protein